MTKSFSETGSKIRILVFDLTYADALCQTHCSTKIRSQKAIPTYAENTFQSDRSTKKKENNVFIGIP